MRSRLLCQPLQNVDYTFAATEEEFIQRNPSARKLQSEYYRVYLRHGQQSAPLAQRNFTQDQSRGDVASHAMLLDENGDGIS